MSADAQIITGVDGQLGRITLNRPRAINAVNHDMLAPIASALAAFGADPAVAAVLIDGAGDRGFCAGGDIRAIYESLLAGTTAAVDYWRDEYEVNLAIARFPKPYIAIMDGLSLGGGVGLSSHGSVRIVTERSLVGLTQVNIGFVPDVGGSYLLTRAPGRLGYYAGLMAAQLGPADAILCGLADVCIASSDIPVVIDAVRAAAGSGSDIRAAVDAYAIEPPPGILAAAQPWVDEAFSAPTVAGIIDALRARPEPGAHAAAEVLATKSPTALRLTLQLLRAGRGRTLEEALAAELEVARGLTAGHDLREGIRAQVIDKDRNPQWNPAPLEELTMTEHDSVTPSDETFLRRAIELATLSRALGDAPFGSLLVDAAGVVIIEDHNTVVTDNDISAHPELKLARWAAQNLAPEAAAAATMYTSCQPCPMCAGAIDRSGLGRVVFALSADQLGGLKPPARGPAVRLDGPAMFDEASAAVAGYYT